MKVIAGVDGSKYGRWATEWIAQLPFASSPQVTALHVVDVVSLRAPFVVQPVVIGNEHFIQTEIKRLETWRKKVAAETKTYQSFEVLNFSFQVLQSFRHITFVHILNKKFCLPNEAPALISQILGQVVEILEGSNCFSETIPRG